MQSADAMENRGPQSESSELDRLVEARTRDLSAFSHHLQAFSEKEKRELARLLHDELGGLLTAAKMDLSWLQSMDLKRRVVEELRPSLLDHFGLPTAVRAYVESTCAKAGLQCELDIEESCHALPKDTAIALFRVVQEGLSNIIRHAGARRVRLVLSGGTNRCVVTLNDDGRGFDSGHPQFASSHGLMGMHQRSSALQGTLHVESQPGAGTTLRVEIPLPA
jgi:signal transduction histidine kinase